MAEMTGYQRYLFRQIEPYLGRRLWEIGVGYGTLTGWLLETGARVLATDIDEQCLDQVRRRWPDVSRLETAHIDLREADSVQALAYFEADTIICINVLEHIEHSTDALRWLRRAASPRAACLLIVPAHPRLYGLMDAEAGHYRRYTRRSARAELEAAGWVVERVVYRNLPGALGWWYHNRWRRSAGLHDDRANRHMRRADRWLPVLARLTDPWFATMLGLSVLAVAKSGAGRSLEMGR